MRTSPLALLPLALACSAALAQPPAVQLVTLDRLTVVGDSGKAEETAGSAAYIDEEALEKHGYRDAQRILRQVPGIYAVDEEGYGLRPNIGIRGSGTDRSSRLTLMEDGVPIAPAVYAAPSAYYFPTAARMNAVEVLKGSATVRSGPRTTGGAINFISTPVPEAGPDNAVSGLLDVAFGTDQTLQTHAFAGGTNGRVGWLLETAQQQSDGFKRLDSGGDSGYTLEDYLGKLRFASSADADMPQSLELKLGKVEQDGDETYLGLTEADFGANPNRRYAASQRDRIVTDHEQTELRHHVTFNDAIDLTTVAYNNEFARNWYKLNDVGGISIGSILADPITHAAGYATITGGDSADDALRVRNNNRRYFSRGVQSVLGWRFDGGGARHDIEIGLRYHHDEEDRYQWDDGYRMDNGSMVLTSAGAPGTQDNRVGEARAIAIHVQDEIRFGDWMITPGLRHESIDLTRTDYLRQPDGRSLAPTRVRESSVSAWLPGIGVTRFVGERTNVFVGAHRGFNPPGPGSSSDPEWSTNIEAGWRWKDRAARAELVGFWNDYSNLVGTCTASSGGDCVIGDQFDGGHARVLGLEAAFGWDFGIANGWDIAAPLDVGYTYTDAEFRSSFDSDFGEWGEVSVGDRMPYLPEHSLHIRLGLDAEHWHISLAGNHIDDMSTNAADSAPRTDSAFVIDLAAGYRLTDNAELFARIENAADETWVASRRPAGLRPGMPRQGYLGLRIKF